MSQSLKHKLDFYGVYHLEAPVWIRKNAYVKRLSCLINYFVRVPRTFSSSFVFTSFLLVPQAVFSYEIRFASLTPHANVPFARYQSFVALIRAKALNVNDAKR